MKYYESFIDYDKREIKLKSIFYNFSRIFYFFSAFLYIIPLCFLSYYPFIYTFNTLDINIFSEFYRKYIFYIPIIFYLTISFHLNMQILKHFYAFYYLFIMNLILYWSNLYGFSFYVTDKILIITYSLILTNFINLIVSHFQIKKNVFYLKDISLFFYEDIFQLKIESFLTFVKYSSFKGILFTFNYLGVYLIIFLNQFLSKKSSIITDTKNTVSALISGSASELSLSSALSNNLSTNLINNFTMASTISFILMALPHSFILSVSKYYRNYLENSVYDHSQNTKTRYLKFFWFILISFTLIFSLIILLLKKTFFEYLINLSIDINENLNTNSSNEFLFAEILQIFAMFDFILKFYCIFILFDSLGIAFQEIIKTFNDHCRNYLNFYKGISLVFVFFPIGIICALCLQWDFIWGFWIGFYSHMIVYSVILMIVTYRNYYNSTFQIFY